MTRERLIELWPAMEAFKAGQQIQYRAVSGWRDEPNPDFEDDETEWRVKPEPREVWVNEYPTYLAERETYRTKESADRQAGYSRIRAVRFREVIE